MRKLHSLLAAALSIFLFAAPHVRADTRGVRASDWMKLSPAWYISGYGDIGGGGFNLTYQLLGTAGASVGEHIAIVFGYRYLDVNFNKDRFRFDTAMQGPVIELTFTF